jgi:arylformamidase
MAGTIYDITPPVSPDLSVWPGDTPVSREVLLDMQRGDNITLSTLRATVHLGAHVDAPSHYGAEAPDIASRGLEPYFGRCQVIHVEIPKGERIGCAQVTSDIVAPRVLIGTGSYPEPTSWNGDFSAFAPELVDAMHAQGVILMGIDTPSVDTFDSKDLPAHRRFLENDMAILEGIVLNGVPEGVYQLVALPLKLVGFDASPVRAILVR